MEREGFEPTIHHCEDGTFAMATMLPCVAFRNVGGGAIFASAKQPFSTCLNGVDELIYIEAR